MPLTTAELDDYRDHGFVRVAGLVSEDRGAALRARVGEYIGSHRPLAPDGDTDGERHIDPCAYSEKGRCGCPAKPVMPSFSTA